ncbi:MAG: 50S ribosomal protein L5 [Candidatus Nanoarchaeia archaeon]
MKTNNMNQARLEKVVLNIGGTGEKLERGVKLLEMLSGKKVKRVKSNKRIPTWNVRPGLEVGVKVTLRGKEAEKMLNRLLPAIKNILKEKQIQDNFISFGIEEYIEIPEMEYIRDVGVLGLEVTAVFSKPGKRVERKKIDKGNAKKLKVSKNEIKEIMINKFKTEIK